MKKTFFIMLFVAATIMAAKMSFSGTWKTNWGDVVLEQKGNLVTGTFSGKYSGTIKGKSKAYRLDFTWEDDKGNSGKGYFELVHDGKRINLEGKFGYGDSNDDGGNWTGYREGGSSMEDVSEEDDNDRKIKKGKPLSKPVFPGGTIDNITCPAISKSNQFPVLDRWLVIISNAGGPSQAMFFNSKTGVLYEVEYPEEYVKDGYYPCWKRCYTFPEEKVIKIFDANKKNVHFIPWKTLNVGMMTYIFGPLNKHKESWDALEYPGWGPNGETDLSLRCSSKY